MRLHPAPEPPGERPENTSPPGCGGRGARRPVSRRERAAPSAARLGPGGAPLPTRVLPPAPRTAAPVAFPTLAAGGAAVAEGDWRAPLGSVAAAGCPREASVQRCPVLPRLPTPS